jgi:hypothetical protein
VAVTLALCRMLGESVARIAPSLSSPTRSPKARFEPLIGKLLYHARFGGANVKNHHLSARKLRPGFFQTFV